MSIPLQFASLYYRQVFMWSNCLLDLGTDFLKITIPENLGSVSTELFVYYCNKNLSHTVCGVANGCEIVLVLFFA